MSQAPGTLGESERRAFVDKVFQFRTTLSPSERRLLDGVISAACGSTGEGDIQAYGLLDSADRLSAALLHLLEQLGQATIVQDPDGTPVGYLMPQS